MATAFGGDLLGTGTELACSRRVGYPRNRQVERCKPLSRALEATLVAAGFEHHVRLQHPRTGDGFEYDFWRPTDGIAIEVMGYRADDEIYKDILKFHVHDGTRVGVVLVPRYKWISSKRTDTNYAATLKALAFADRYMAVEALVMFAYDWSAGSEDGLWRLTFTDAEL